jgi:hypothetical protein
MTVAIIDNRGVRPVIIGAGAEVAGALVAEAKAARDAAADAQDAAETAQDAAELAATGAVAAGNLYPTTSAGLAATAEGGYFNVVGDGNTFAILYREESGVAVEKGRYPNKSAVDAKVDTATLAAETGTAGVGHKLPSADAFPTTAAQALAYRVHLLDFIDPDDRAAVIAGTFTDPLHEQMTKAINYGSKRLTIGVKLYASAAMTLRDNQVIDFAGGEIIVPLGASISGAVLKSNGGAGIGLIDPRIDASALPINAIDTGLTGCRGIDLTNVNDGWVRGGKLKRADMVLNSSDNTVDRELKVSDTVIDLDGRNVSAVYVSGVRNVVMRAIDSRGGKEGIGIYNAARAIQVSHGTHRNHTGDGILLFSGQNVLIDSVIGKSNGQSGFCTQRATSGDDTRFFTIKGCLAEYNTYDGYDIRGANPEKVGVWGVPMVGVLSGNIARSNALAGIYVVKAEGVTVGDCTCAYNGLQNFQVDESSGTILNAPKSISGAAAVSRVSPGTPNPNKSGILIFQSNGVQVNGPISGNSDGSTQDYGIAFTGGSDNGRVIGGDLSNNIAGPFVAAGNAIVSTQANETAGVFLLELSENGIYREQGFGPPTHLRPFGSTYQRLDGGGESYVSIATSATPSWRSY